MVVKASILRGLPLRHHGFEVLCRLVFSRICRVEQGGREVSEKKGKGKTKSNVVRLMRYYLGVPYQIT